jgi:hypothetical protein
LWGTVTQGTFPPSSIVGHPSALQLETTEP